MSTSSRKVQILTRSPGLRAASFAVAYFGLAWFGELLTFKPSFFNTFWPNSGLFLAVLLSVPTRQWPLFVAAALPANLVFDFLHGRPLWMAGLFAAANIVEALVGAALVRRRGEETSRLLGLQDAAALVAACGLVSTPLGAAIGTAAVQLAGGGQPLLQWLKWWSTDALGILLVAPPLLVWWSPREPLPPRRLRALEAVLMLVCTAAVAVFAFYDHSDAPGKKFLVMPVIVWGALRFGVLGASASAVVASICGALAGVYLDPLSGRVPAASDVVLLQGGLASYAATALVLGTTYRERLAAEGAAREREARYRSLFNGVQDAVFVHGTASASEPDLFVEVNEAACAMTGYSREELLTMSPRDLAPDGEAGDGERVGRELFSGGVSRFGGSVSTKGGRRVPVEGNARLTDLADRRVVVTIMRDVSARREAEQALRTKDYAIASSVSGVALGDLEGRITYVNDAFLGLWSYAGTSEVVGRHTSEFWVDPEKARRVFEGLSGGGWKGQLEALRKDGKRFVASVAASLVRDDAGQPVCVLAWFEDATERAVYEERLRQADKMEAIGQLAGGIAHDFNNQLAVIMGSAELLLQETGDASARELAAAIRTAAARSADLTSKLLAFARKGNVASMAVDVHALIRDVIALLGRSIDKRIEVVESLRAVRHLVLGDPTQLQNALLNIALNSRDAMPSGGRLTFSTEVQEIVPSSGISLSGGAHLVVEVSDTGSGMDQETLRRLFEPFFTTKPPGRGTGLGLAAVYGTVKSHHGGIVVRSEPGKGTTVTVHLPLLDAAESAAARRERDEVVRGGGRVLVVDDEPGVRQLVTAMLRRFGYDVTACGDGAEAIDLFRRTWREVDVVVLDLMMPRVGGREAFAALREIDPNARVLIASGYSLDGDAQAILDAGAAGFLQKPFVLAELSRSVAAAMQRQPGEARRRDA